MTRILIVLFSLSFLIACGDDGGAPTPPPPPNFSRDSGTSPEDDCTPESDEALCTLHEAECGELIVTDSCGEERVVDCGDGAELCAAPETCGGGEKANVCGCAGEPDEELCEAAEAECGSIEVTDRCGLDRAINCGDEDEVCEAPFTCGGGENPNACGCTAEETDEDLCAANGAQCGELVIEDSCGILRTIESCGECEGFDECAGGGVANVCGCTPDFIDERTDEEICAAEQAECGVLQIADSCGVTRPVHCDDGEDPCEGPNRCGGGGEPNVCGCTPEESDEELCELHGAECGDLEITDSCGVKRTINCDDPEMPCVLPTSCGGGGEANRCGCTADEDPLIYCAAIDATCGVILATNSCGDLQNVNCGDEAEVCEPHETCGGAGEEHACGCTPTTCELSNYVCGIFDNGCAGELECDDFCVDLVRAGAEHGCMLGSGSVRCWGRGQNGRLGLGNTTNQRNPQKLNLGGAIAIDLSLGTAHSCAILDDGRVLCWGANERGQLGNGTTVEVRAPDLQKVINFPVQAPVEKIGAGVEHSCALVDARVYCWGSNAYGQIGDNSLDYGKHSAVPQAVFGLDEGVVDLAVGAYHSCALKQDDPNEPIYSVHCWGRNHRGQLGNLVENAGAHFRDGPSSTCSHHPVVAFDVGVTGTNALDQGTRHEHDHAKPVQVGGLPDDIVELTVGEGFSCALSASGKLYCWGAMTRGFDAMASACDVLGDKNPDACAIWPPKSFNDHPNVAPITRLASLCCGTGDNQHCEDETVDHLFVNRAALRPIELDEHVAAIAAGDNHLCVIRDNTSPPATNVYCIGVNGSGQLGDGTNNDRGAPQATQPNDGVPLRAAGLSLGSAFSCAHTDDPPGVQCWGSNSIGQIGNDALDTNKNALRPYDVRIDYIP